MSVKLTGEVRPLASLKPHEHNTKTHPEKQVAQIARSIELFGFNDPIAILPDGTIVEGEGRFRAATSLGLADVPVLVLDGLSEREADLYRIAHNKIALTTGFDLDALMDSLREITGGGKITLGDLGFDSRASKNILNAFDTTSTAQQAVSKPVYEIVWDDDRQKARWNAFVRQAKADHPTLGESEAILASLEASGVFSTESAETIHEEN